MNSNCAAAHLWLGACLVFTDRTAEGRAAPSVASRLSPRDQIVASDVNVISYQSYYFDRDYERCIAAARYQLSAFPGHRLAYIQLAAALGQLGRTEEARAALDTFKALVGDRFNLGNRLPFYRPEDHEHRLAGLRKAGWEG